jgi:type VI secretion system secreted protein Hcp
MATGDFFLKLDGIDGESQDDAHKDEIQCSSITWGVSNAGSGGFGTGSGSSKSAVGDIHITKLVDKSSPNLLKACCTGQTIGSAVVTMRKAGGDSPVEYSVYKLDEVFVSSFNTSAHDGGGIGQESLSLNFSKINFVYTPQKADGTPDSTSEMTYDIKANKAS